MRRIFAGLFLFASVFAQKDPVDALEGYWRGSVEIGSTTIDVGLDIFKIGKTFAATADDIGKREFGIPVTFIVVMGGGIHLEHPTLKAVYDAKLSESGNELRGTLELGGKYQMNLRRSVRPAVLPSNARPQEPAGVLPYTVDGVIFMTGDVRMRGTMVTPRGAGPFPSAVLVNRAGQLDRDESTAGHKPYLVLSDLLARRGVLTLRVDARGSGSNFGNSGAAPAAQTESIETMTADASAALQFLKKQRNVDPKRTGYIGHGEGGLAAAIASSQGDESAFLVLLAAPGVTADRLELERADARLTLEGAPADVIEWYKAWISGLTDIVKHEPDSLSAQRKMTEWTEKKKADRPERAREFIDAAAMQAALDRVDSPGFRELMKWDPAAVLAHLKIPVLALAGSRDIEVPSKDNLPPIFAALSQAGNSNFDVKEIPDLNHLFQRCITCREGEYNSLQETFSPVAVRAISDWLLHISGGPRVRLRLQRDLLGSNYLELL
jgi:pimeloyl-ACP methyl ester carboxylesterase